MTEIVRKRLYISTSRTEQDVLSIADTGEDLDGNLILAQIAYRDMSYWEDIANRNINEAKRQRTNN